jgi:hypothetical protein
MASRIIASRVWKPSHRNASQSSGAPSLLPGRGRAGPFSGFRQPAKGPAHSRGALGRAARRHPCSRGCHRRTAPTAPRCPPR